MNLLRTVLASMACIAFAAPAAAQQSFLMDFDGPSGIIIPSASPDGGPDDPEFGSAVLGYYNGDPGPNNPPFPRAGNQNWDITFSPEALAICAPFPPITTQDDCSGNFPKPPSGVSAVGTVAEGITSFSFSVTPGLYVSKLSFDYTNGGAGSDPAVVLFSNGAQLGNPLVLTTCTGGFCWASYEVSAEDLARGLVTSVQFQGQPNLVAFDNIAVTTAAIPEPSSYALMIGGLALLVGVARRRTSAAG
jgi:hypothetical protein